MGMKVNDFATIPSRTEVWSIDLQQIITFKKNIPVKIKNTCHGSSYVFVQIHEEFQCIGFQSELRPTKNELGVDSFKLKSYVAPDIISIYFDLQYSNQIRRVQIEKSTSLSNFANMVGISYAEIIGQFMKNGMMTSLGQEIGSDSEMIRIAKEIGRSLNFEINFISE